MEMFDPPHAGEIIREACLEPLGLTGMKARRQAASGATPVTTPPELLNGRRRRRVGRDRRILAGEGIRQHGGDMVAHADQT